MKLPSNEYAIRDYIEWQARRADELLKAWNWRRMARTVGIADAFRADYKRAAKNALYRANAYKRDMKEIRDELKKAA